MKNPAPHMPKPIEILQKHWGYSQFRPLQLEIITEALHGRDILALLPTGGGKSICFQVPALCLGGLCVVVTPLIALMHDQVANLRKSGIPAVYVHSGMSRQEADAALASCGQGETAFLYVSPERLLSSAFRETLRFLPVKLWVVDEAHCISQWGYDFRPAYLQIARVREFFPGIPLMALTATAVPAVCSDIMEQLHFSEKNIIAGSFLRGNLSYLVYPEDDKSAKLLRICRGVGGSGIVYVRNRRHTREIAEFLSLHQIIARAYHAGMSPDERSTTQTAWMQGEVRVIVATNAFGMGIDKPDVRFVVHMDLPDNLEAYYQEAGRAGRDEKRSYAAVIYGNHDLSNAESLLQQSWPEPEQIRLVYEAVGNYLQVPVGTAEGESFDFDLASFAKQYNLKVPHAFHCLQVLEREGYFALNDAFDQPSRLLFTCPRDLLYAYQVAHPDADLVIKAVLRLYSGLFTEYTRINENEVALRSATDQPKVVKILQELNAARIVDYLPMKNKPQLIFLTGRLASDEVMRSKDKYENRKREAFKKWEQVKGYLAGNSLCRARFLSAYFGEQLNKDCGVCDVCIAKIKNGPSESELQEMKLKIIALLRDQSHTLGEMVRAMPRYPERSVIGLLRSMAEDEILLLSDESVRLNPDSAL